MAGKKGFIKVFYLGQDLGYYKNLQIKFQGIYHKLKFEFETIKNPKEIDPEKAFQEILNGGIDILFLDFSKNIEKCLKLARLLRRDTITKKISSTGLFDYLQTRDDHSRSLMAGMRINHVKSVENSDVVYDAMYFFDPTEVIELPLAMAKFQMEQKVIIDLRISYATKTFFHIESNLNFRTGEKINLIKNPLIKWLKTTSFEIGKISDEDLYYNYANGIDLNYLYANNPADQPAPEVKPPTTPTPEGEVEVASGPDPKKLADAIKEYENTLKQCQEDVAEWIETKSTKVSPKFTKVLIIDKKADFINSLKKPLDSYPYTINFHSKLEKDYVYIKRTKPNIIAFVFENPPKGDPAMAKGKGEKNIYSEVDPFDTNGAETLQAMTTAVKSIPQYEPIIVVFSAQHKSETLQTNLGYKKVISYTDGPSFDIIEKFSMIYNDSTSQKKKAELTQLLQMKKKEDPKKWNGKKIEDLEEKKVYFAGEDLGKIAHMEKKVNFIGLQENKVYFKTKEKYPIYTVIKSLFPVEMLITIVPLKPTDEYSKTADCYCGLVNGVNENGKKEIRQFINNILGTEKRQAEEAAKAEFKQKNSQTLQAKIDEEAKASAEENADKKPE
jgi:hypothetical protein